MLVHSTINWTQEAEVRTNKQNYWRKREESANIVITVVLVYLVLNLRAAMVVFVSAPCVLATILIAIDNRAGKHYISAMANDGDREQLIRSAVKRATNKGIQLKTQKWGGVLLKKDKSWVPKSDQKSFAFFFVILE